MAKWLSRQTLLAECLPLRGQLRQSLLLQAKIPDSRLTTTLESNREHLTPRIIYNINMDEINNDLDDIQSPSLLQRMDVLSSKLEVLQHEIQTLVQQKSFMEIKISDAQGRIQKILNKLPQATDTRQLTLLDNSSETTHE